MIAALGIVLIVIGAIVTFAIDRQAEGVDLAALGWILMAGGAIALVVAAIRGAGWMAASRTGIHTERHTSADGQHYVEDSRTV